MRTVIVLVGGKGQRFRKLLEDIPKPLIKVHTRSQLFWACKGAHLSYGPNKFIFATRSGLVERISEELMSFEFLDEFEVVDVGESTLGPAHTLKLALDRTKNSLEDSQIVVIDNDCFNLLRITLDSTSFPFVTLTESNNPQHCFVELAPNSDVVRFHEKERVGKTAVSGNYGFVYSSQVQNSLTDLLASVKSDREPYLSDLMAQLLKQNPIKAFEVNEYYSLGTPSEIAVIGNGIIDYAEM
jgi:NDP-sugar pyrophosphorylase family protein